MVTIKDIAVRLGVANSTVGRALANHPAISEETKQKVRFVATEIGYIPHSAAQIMRGQKSTLIGLIIPDVENDFYATMARAMAECCEAAGFQLVLSITEDSPESELQHLRLLSSARAAGVVIVPSSRPLPESLKLMRLLPIVQLIRKIADLDSDQLTIDDTRGIREATLHLTGLGHKKIAYIGASKELSTGAARLKGFQLALKEAGIAPDPKLTATGVPRAIHGRDAFLEIYRSHRPTAVIVGGARIMIGALSAIAECGIETPKQLSVIGFGDPPWAQWWGGFGLTTLALPVRDIAAEAGALLIRRIIEQRDKKAPVPTYYSAVHHPYLVIRKSTAPLRRK